MRRHHRRSHPRRQHRVPLRCRNQNTDEFFVASRIPFGLVAVVMAAANQALVPAFRTSLTQRGDRSTDRLISMVLAVVSSPELRWCADMAIAWSVHPHDCAGHSARAKWPRRLDGARRVRDGPARRGRRGHARVPQCPLRVCRPRADDGRAQRSCAAMILVFRDPRPEGHQDPAGRVRLLAGAAAQRCSCVSWRSGRDCGSFRRWICVTSSCDPSEGSASGRSPLPGSIRWRESASS